MNKALLIGLLIPSVLLAEPPQATRPLWVKDVAIPAMSVTAPETFGKTFADELARQIWERDFGTVRGAPQNYLPALEVILLNYQPGRLEIVARQYGTLGQIVWQIRLKDVDPKTAIKRIASEVRPEFKPGYKYIINK